MNTINHLTRLTASPAKHDTDILCEQEHRFYHSKIQGVTK